MSDIPPPPQQPPPPPSAGPPPAPPVPAAPASVDKPPRPNVQIAGILMIVGGALAIIGVFLPWLSFDGETLNGTDDFITTDFDLYESPGYTMVFFGLVVLGLGIALVAAGRVLAVAIIGIVAAAITVFLSIGFFGIVDDMRTLGDGSYGLGLFTIIVGAGLALGGSIWATSRRRR